MAWERGAMGRRSKRWVLGGGEDKRVGVCAVERRDGWSGLKISKEIRPAIGTGYSFQPVPISRASIGTGSWNDPVLMSAP